MTSFNVECLFEIDLSDLDEPDCLEGAPSGVAGRGASSRKVFFWIGAIACAVIISGLVRTFVIEPYEVPTASMAPTIEVGDRVFGEKVSLDFAGPERGDIVTFVDPEDPSTTLVKRVIGCPGDTIELDGGRVVVNGSYSADIWGQGVSYPISGSAFDVDYPYVLGEDEYFMMGDNRGDSLDSRWFGAIKKSDMTSKIVFRFWPLSRLGCV